MKNKSSNLMWSLLIGRNLKSDFSKNCLEKLALAPHCDHVSKNYRNIRIPCVKNIYKWKLKIKNSGVEKKYYLSGPLNKGFYLQKSTNQKRSINISEEKLMKSDIILSSQFFPDKMVFWNNRKTILIENYVAPSICSRV